MKSVLLLALVLCCSTLLEAQTCSGAPSQFVYNGAGPFGYTCSDKNIILPYLDLQVVQFPAPGTVVVKWDLSYSCCNSGPGGCGTGSFNIPAPYRLAASNFLRADGYCSWGSVNDGVVNGQIQAQTAGCTTDDVNINNVCGTRANCGCQYTSCSVVPLNRVLNGTITLAGWGDCTTTTVYGPYNSYTQTVVLNYDCWAPAPFVLGASGSYGYTCGSDGVVHLTALGGAAVTSFNTATKTVVVAKDFSYGCCNSAPGGCGHVSWTLPAGYQISTSNYLKADGYCAVASIWDSAGTPLWNVYPGSCTSSASNILDVCGTLANCGCQFACGVAKLQQTYNSTVTIGAFGDCTTTTLWGPSNTYTKTVALTYGN